MHDAKFNEFITEVEYLKPDISKYFEELVRSYENENYRSTIVLMWGVVLFHVYKKIEKFGLENFKTRYSEKGQHVYRDIFDLSNLEDNELLQYALANGIFTDLNINKILIGLKDKRNQAAHVNSIDFGKEDIYSFCVDSLKAIKIIEEDMYRNRSFDMRQFSKLDYPDYGEYVKTLSPKQKIDLLNYLLDVISDNYDNLNTELSKLGWNFANYHSILSIELANNNKNIHAIKALYNNSGYIKPDIERILVDKAIIQDTFTKIYPFMAIFALLNINFPSNREKTLFIFVVINSIKYCWQLEIMHLPIKFLEKYWKKLEKTDRQKIVEEIDSKEDFQLSWSGMAALCQLINENDDLRPQHFRNIRKNYEDRGCDSKRKKECILEKCIFKKFMT
ncbi:hypothetical protein HNP93_001014 [Methanococcus maripaludis]|uniref:Uncharacterized protein n=1 Tax=Methanococcus maripaludis TaxID=39152 RepID=A0A7J9P543_METMI|nr:hypothetical protein [Methanococcus maripaludis]MBA2858313.1 hypothetical protein [Methanococcus maripaludis]